MKIELRDEQGNIVTPRKGDYVMACDIVDEEMHNAIRDAFADAGCVVAEHGKYVNQPDWHWLAWIKSSYTYGSQGCLSWADPMEGYRRLYPHAIKQTLFEAAKDAPEGTRFKVGLVGLTAIKRGKDGWYLCNQHGNILPWSYCSRADFEQLPTEPKKRDVATFTVTSNVPSDKANECADAFGLIARICMWEGAQVGQPGWVMGHVSKTDDVSIEPYHMSMVMPDQVTFKTKEQCLAAWKAECPELFE